MVTKVNYFVTVLINICSHIKTKILYLGNCFPYICSLFVFIDLILIVSNYVIFMQIHFLFLHF